MRGHTWPGYRSVSINEADLRVGLVRLVDGVPVAFNQQTSVHFCSQFSEFGWSYPSFFFYRVFNRSFFCVVPKRNLNRKKFVSIALLLWPRVPKNERELMIFQHCDWFYWLMIHMFCLYQTIMSSRRVFLYLVLLDFNRLLYKKLNNRQ